MASKDKVIEKMEASLSQILAKYPEITRGTITQLLTEIYIAGVRDVVEQIKHEYNLNDR